MNVDITNLFGRCLCSHFSCWFLRWPTPGCPFFRWRRVSCIWDSFCTCEGGDFLLNNCLTKIWSRRGFIVFIISFFIWRGVGLRGLRRRCSWRCLRSFLVTCFTWLRWWFLRLPLRHHRSTFWIIFTAFTKYTFCQCRWFFVITLVLWKWNKYQNLPELKPYENKSDN